MHGFNRA